MFEIIVFVVGLGVGSIITHFGYQNSIALIKTELIIAESKIKSLLNR